MAQGMYSRSSKEHLHPRQVGKAKLRGRLRAVTTLHYLPSYNGRCWHFLRYGRPLRPTCLSSHGAPMPSVPSHDGPLATAFQPLLLPDARHAHTRLPPSFIAVLPPPHSRAYESLPSSLPATTPSCPSSVTDASPSAIHRRACSLHPPCTDRTNPHTLGNWGTPPHPSNAPTNHHHQQHPQATCAHDKE